MKLSEKALVFACKAHQGQTRKYNGKPYIVHPIRVAKMVEKYSQDEEVLAAAYLHDVIEDTYVTWEEIESEFGSRVTNIVNELTNISIQKEYKHLNRALRKEMDRKYIQNGCEASQLIKCCDRIDNLKDMKGAKDSFKDVYAYESLLLAKVLTKAPPELVAKLVDLANSMLPSAREDVS